MTCKYCDHEIVGGNDAHAECLRARVAELNLAASELSKETRLLEGEKAARDAVIAELVGLVEQAREALDLEGALGDDTDAAMRAAIASAAKLTPPVA